MELSSTRSHLMNKRHLLEPSQRVFLTPSAVSALNSSVLYHHSSLAMHSTVILKVSIIATYVRTQKILKMISKLNTPTKLSYCSKITLWRNKISTIILNWKLSSLDLCKKKFLIAEAQTNILHIINFFKNWIWTFLQHQCFLIVQNFHVKGET